MTGAWAGVGGDIKSACERLTAKSEQHWDNTVCGGGTRDNRYHNRAYQQSQPRRGSLWHYSQLQHKDEGLWRVKGLRYFLFMRAAMYTVTRDVTSDLGFAYKQKQKVVLLQSTGLEDLNQWMNQSINGAFASSLEGTYRKLNNWSEARNKFLDTWGPFIDQLKQ